MTQSSKRSAKHSTANANGLPVVDDVTLIGLALGTPALLDRSLNDPFCIELVALSKSIKRGKFGQLKRSMRDQLLKLVAEADMLPRHKPKKTIATHVPDAYDARETSGTKFAERIRSMRPLAPPGRRSA